MASYWDQQLQMQPMDPIFSQSFTGYNPSASSAMDPNQAQGWAQQWGGAQSGYPMPQSTKLGANFGTANAVFSGLQTLGGLWSAFQQNKMAKQAQKTALAFANKNLENQTMAYNAQVEDTGRSRAFMEGMSPQQAQAYLDQTKLKYAPVR